MDGVIHDGAECMSVHAVAGLIKFFPPVTFSQQGRVGQT